MVRRKIFLPGQASIKSNQIKIIYFPQPIRYICHICFMIKIHGIRIYTPPSSVPDPWSFDMDPDPWKLTVHWLRIRIRILLFSSLAFKITTKNKFFPLSFFVFLLLIVGTFTSVKAMKSQNSRNQGFFSIFCLLMEGSVLVITNTSNLPLLISVTETTLPTDFTFQVRAPNVYV